LWSELSLTELRMGLRRRWLLHIRREAVRPRARFPLLTAAECLEIADRKMGEAVSDRRHGKELRATAQAWLVLAERIAQADAFIP
jgi:hypothetical protein